MTQVRLVVFEAWNITRFISVTNKRREIAGASELITYLDRRWVGRALTRIHRGFEAGWRIEDQPVEILESGAGNAKVLVRDGEVARRLVTEVTTAALREAPGLEVCGVVSEPFDWSVGGLLHQALQQAERDLEPVRTALPGPDARFLRLPIVDECATTGLPAESLARQPDGSWEPRSAESDAKWRAYGKQGEGDGLGRLAELAGTQPQQLARVVDRLSGECDWVGVVYADGNGLGEAFGNFDACVEDGSNRCYADTLRVFSAAVQRSAKDAFAEAVGRLEALGARPGRGGPVPVLPLILGGDDLVAVCEGRWALPFAEAYLRAFERLTAEASEISVPLVRRGMGPGLSACAGVAIVKPHFPFAAAQNLAFRLMKDEAKQVKEAIRGRPCSAVSFHVLYDSSGADLDRIRDRQQFAGAPDGGEIRLVAQPYVVSDVPDDHEWAWGRRWRDLERRVAVLAARDDEGERVLPAAQLHDLREALFLGRAVADGRFANLRQDYGARGLDELSGTPDSLFWQEPPQQHDDGRTHGAAWVTGLLDAMDVDGFLPTGAEL
ncbi:hypothetical protein [Streptomyces sp900105755]|uniref:Cas10/Cmr2 second palm domain-containing protein n=1 Tax=Streptomyces sp. 900105755 TaxID=3154389 RepID=A0ABV1TWL0_9ACTN